MFDRSEFCDMAALSYPCMTVPNSIRLLIKAGYEPDVRQMLPTELEGLALHNSCLDAESGLNSLWRIGLERQNVHIRPHRFHY